MSHRSSPYTALVLADSPDALSELCGVSVLERLLRTLLRCGCARAIILTDAPDLVRQSLAQPSPARAGLTTEFQTHEAGAVTFGQIIQTWPDSSEDLLILPGNAVFDERLLRALREQEASVALVDSSITSPLEALVSSIRRSDGGRICGPVLLTHAWASAHAGTFEEVIFAAAENGTIGVLDVQDLPTYSGALRRELRPLWFPAPFLQNKSRAEGVLLNAAQKGTLDFPAWVHAPIENLLIARLCKTSITPNQLTVFCNIVAWLATLCFAMGALVGGTTLALAVGVLDGLDGKQARVKVETSEAGKLEHWFDAFFELSWWFALAYHLQRSGQLPSAFNYLLLLLVAEAVDLGAKGLVLYKKKRLIDELSRFDRVVRLFGGRRNIYIWIFAIGLLLGAPAPAFVLIAWWEVITSALHVPRAAWIAWRS